MERPTIYGDAATYESYWKYRHRKRRLIFEIIFNATLTITSLIIASTNTDARSECGSDIWEYVLQITAYRGVITIRFGPLLKMYYSRYYQTNIDRMRYVLRADKIHNYIYFITTTILFIWGVIIRLTTNTECKKHMTDKYVYLWYMFDALLLISTMSISIRVLEFIARHISTWYRDFVNKRALSQHATDATDATDSV